MLPEVSRTFALSIAALPASMRDAVRIAYLLCRIVDTIEDEPGLRADRRYALYDAFDALLDDDGLDPAGFEALSAAVALGGEGPYGQLCRRAGAAFRRFRALSVSQRAAIRPHVAEMSHGMREYTLRAEPAGRLRIHDVDELERYCHFVAGTVGKLLTALFEQVVPGLSDHDRAALRARAVSFGVGLQLVNIVKDVAEDLERGDCFLPESLATERGLRLEDLLDPAHRQAGLEVLAVVCERARQHLRRAEQYIALWPAVEGREVRLFCVVPLVLALATLREVQAGHDALLPDRTPKISREAVMRIFKDAQRAVDRNDTLAWMLGYYASGSYLTPSIPAELLDRAPVARPPARAPSAVVAPGADVGVHPGVGKLDRTKETVQWLRQRASLFLSAWTVRSS